MGKDRYFGGILGVDPKRGGTETTLTASGGPLRFDDSTYGRVGTDCLMGPYSSSGILLENNSTTNSRGFGLDFNAAGFSGNFYVEVKRTGTTGFMDLGVSEYDFSNLSTWHENGQRTGVLGSQVSITLDGSNIDPNPSGVGGTVRSLGGINTLCLAYEASSKKVYIGFKYNTGSTYWFIGGNNSTAHQAASWQTSLPTSNPSYTMTNAAKTLWIKLDPSYSATYYAENWTATNAPSGYNELQNSSYSTSTTTTATTYATSGIFTPQELGFDNKTLMRQGGILGSNVETTSGIWSLKDLWYMDQVPNDSVLDRSSAYILDRDGNYITTR